MPNSVRGSRYQSLGEGGDDHGGYHDDSDDVFEDRDALQETLEATLRHESVAEAARGWCPCACVSAPPPELTPVLEASQRSLMLRPGADGAWSWLVAVCAFINSIVIDGIGFSAGILNERLIMDKFLPDKDKDWQISLVNSVLTGVYLGSAPLVSILGDRLGYRPVAFVGAAIGCVGFVAASFTPQGYIWLMIFLYSVVGGIGMGLTYLPSMVMTALNFDKHRPLALGFVTSGSGIGIVLFSVLSPIIYENIGWQGMMRIQAGMIAVGMVTSLSFRPMVSQGEESFLNVLKKRLRSLVRLPAFWVLVLLTFTGTFGLFTNFAFIPRLGQERGYNTFAYLIAIIGGVSVVARFIVTGVIQTRLVAPLLLLGACHVAGGIVMTCSTFYLNFTALAVFATVVGIVYAADASLTQEIIAGSLGKRYLSVGFGLLCLCRGVAALISPPILDSLDNLDLTFQIGGGALIVTGVLAFVMFVLVRRRENAKAQARAYTAINTEQKCRVADGLQSANQYGSTEQSNN